ncbi:MAG TPA: hypothetical protein VFE35_12060 [Candidatus Cybelea sp.]|nr:hypothetical protein [Candidatus Cybelea sp.]
MQTLRASALDNLTRVGAGAGYLFLWVFFEQQILEPSGLYRFLPFYRVNGVCIWDVAAVSFIVGAFVLAARKKT